MTGGIAASTEPMSWDQRFFDPIVVPGRKPLVTLREAAQYITELPKAEHDADEWQAAMRARDNIADVSWGDGFAAINMPRNPRQNWSTNNLFRERPCRSRRLILMSPIPRPPIPY